MSKNVCTLVEAAIFALAMALSFIPDFASWFTPSFGAVPLVLFGNLPRSKYGILAGLIWGPAALCSGESLLPQSFTSPD